MRLGPRSADASSPDPPPSPQQAASSRTPTSTSAAIRRHRRGRSTREVTAVANLRPLTPSRRAYAGPRCRSPWKISSPTSARPSRPPRKARTTRKSWRACPREVERRLSDEDDEGVVDDLREEVTKFEVSHPKLADDHQPHRRRPQRHRPLTARAGSGLAADADERPPASAWWRRRASRPCAPKTAPTRTSSPSSRSSAVPTAPSTTSSASAAALRAVGVVAVSNACWALVELVAGAVEQQPEGPDRPGPLVDLVLRVAEDGGRSPAPPRRRRPPRRGPCPPRRSPGARGSSETSRSATSSSSSAFVSRIASAPSMSASASGNRQSRHRQADRGGRRPPLAGIEQLGVAIARRRPGREQLALVASHHVALEHGRRPSRSHRSPRAGRAAPSSRRCAPPPRAHRDRGTAICPASAARITSDSRSMPISSAIACITAHDVL